MDWRNPNDRDWDEAEAHTGAIYGDMIRDTEAEIARSAFQTDDADDDDAEGDFDIEAELVEGWDGRPLGDDEQLEKILRNDWSAEDRPLQADREIASADEVENLRSELAVAQGALTQQTSMEQAAWAERDRAAFVSHLEAQGGLVIDPDRAGALHQQNLNRFNGSMTQAHQEHGEAFEAAFSKLQAAVQAGHPLARQTLNYLRYESANAGRDLMAFAASDGPSALGARPAGKLPPSIYGGASRRSASPQQARGGRARPAPSAEPEWGNAADEHDIFMSAFG